MFIRSERLVITELSMDMCSDIQKNSLDEDNRRFVPDEVFETYEEAEKRLKWLIASYKSSNGPFVYPIIINDNVNIGYVQACPIKEGYEIGYHIAKKYTGNGFATEAIRVFLPEIMTSLGINKIYGIVLEENAASYKVLEKCGFKLTYKGVGKYQGVERAIRRYIFEQ